jgi:hypothetical protein
VATAAAVALVVATGTASLVRGAGTPEPAGPSLRDVVVPQRVDLIGFPYELSGIHRADGDGDVETGQGADGPQAVSLVATGLGTGEATLWAGLLPIARVRGDQQVSAATDAPSLDALRVEFDGAPDTARAEVAVYQPTGALPPGHASDGVVFRQQYADRDLVAAAFGTAGGEASADVTGSNDDLNVSAYCHSSTPDLWLHTAGTTGGTPCGDLDTGNDPGASNQHSLLPPQPGDRTYSVYVTQGKEGPRATGVDVTFGFGIYRQAIAPIRMLGTDLASVIEAAGRRWVLDDVLASDDGDYEVDTSHGDVFVAVAYRGALGMSVSWASAPEGGWGGFRETEPQGPGAIYPGVLLAGDHTVHLNLTGPDAESRLGVYRPE